ncbi:MAG: Cof-type HAD-IIB family hydrolase [Eubacteriales bacterium]|nr:Cof-type HAD-IIB family hydrolase [Eubacteriales bacterium]
MYKLIALDLDGTVLNSKIEVLPSTIEAVAFARRQGIKVVVATGRIVGEAAQFAREIGASSAMITSGGAAISDPVNKLDVKEWTIPVETSAQIMEHLQGRPISAMIYVGEHLYMTSYSDRQFKKSRRVEGYWSSRVIEDDIARRIREEQLGVCKIFARGDLTELADALCQFNCLPGIYITRSAEDNFEVMPSGINKGHALRTLADLMGISMEQVIAIGDSDNDSDMLKACGMPVVMANGDDAVKKLARYLTSSNDEGGVAQAIYHLCG